MKVAYVLSSVSRANGGISESVRRLAQSVERQPGITASAFGLTDSFTATDAPLWNPVPVQCFPTRGPCAIGYSPELNRALADATPDILHTAGLWMYPSVATRRAHHRTGKPYVVSPHGMLDTWALKNSGWKKRLAALAYERAHLEEAACLHALNEAEARAIRAYGLRNPICVVPNGVDLPDLEQQTAPPPWSSTIGTDKSVLLFLGRLHPKKGLPQLLRAWATLGDAGWHLVIAGWDQGGHRAELEALAREKHLESRVSFSGPLHGEQKEAAYRAASAFVLPSLSEGLPMTVLEAASYRLPVLMTDACNLPEGFHVGAAQKISADETALVEQLKTFFGLSETEQKTMGRRAREWVKASFDWNEIARDILAVYRWVAGAGERPAFAEEQRHG